jgi:hypothetical protein
MSRYIVYIPILLVKLKQYSVHCYQDENEYRNLSGLVTRIEVALVDRPRRKRARADTGGNRVQVIQYISIIRR